jgi:DNA replication protein DnaC
MEPFEGSALAGKAKVYWRKEDRQVVLLVLKSLNVGTKKTILYGSPGMGKSLLLVLILFHAA